jgi:hypothetical protein
MLVERLVIRGLLKALVKALDRRVAILDALVMC